VQGLPSDEQAVPFVFLASAGQLVLDPGQFSCRSHSSAALRQAVDDVENWQPVVQHEPNTPLALPRSHCSLTDPSIVPLPQREVNVTVTK
jgi:hypothetical protein